MKTRSLLVIALLVIFSVFSYANALNITFDYDTVYMQTNSNASVIAQVENVSDDKVCFDVYSYIDTDEIKMIPAIKDLCLNSNERTEFSIAFISDEDADYGTYTAELELVYDDTSLSREITLELEEIDTIELGIPEMVTFYNEGYTKEIPIDVINRSDETQTITLTADSMLFVPFFDESKIRVKANSTKTVNLVININRTTQEGSYKIDVYARTADYYVQREVNFRITEKEDAKDFEITSIPSRVNIDKGEEERIYAYIKNLKDEEITVKVSFIGDLPNNHAHEITIAANDTESVKIELSARENEAGGLHKFKFYAWTSNQEETKTVRVYVDEEHELLIEVLNEVSIFACDLANGTFEIKITNTGDYNESISLDTRGLPSGITAVFSDDEFDLNAGKSTIVYLSVHASYGVSLGEKSFYVEADAGSEDYDKKLEFEVLEAPEAEEKIRGVLQIVSYPQDLKITSGEETEVEVMLYNDSDEEITVVETTSVDAPNAIYMFFPQTNVPAKETVTVKGKLVAGSSVDAGNYSFRLVSYSKDYIDEKIVSVEVESSNDSDDGDDGNDDEENGFFAGLITLGAFIPGIGGGVSILILAVVIIYVGYLLLRRDKIEENNKWMLYKKQGF